MYICFHIGTSSSNESKKSGSGNGPSAEDDESWRAKFLLKEVMDFDLMDHKCSTNQYRILEEFRADAQLIVHNTVIFHGGE